MTQARISELKNSLSAYLRLVRSGESVLVLDRDTPVARLVPVEMSPVGTSQADSVSDAEERMLQDEALLAKLESRGVVARRRRGPPPIEVVRSWDAFGKDAGLVEAVLEERGEDSETGYR